ncbi:MAG TPA: Zn-dependent alcohol dehydrogenase [Mycobacteriales bacterium]|nr:Zn-dependent alcohol dehydrogenase [Mycobacteriales bacterium]
MKAALLHNVGDDKLDVRDDVTTTGVGPGKVRIRIRATGVCHSDLSAMNGTIPVAVPAVLGHEGAGEVVEVGAGVSTLAEGDHVVVCWSPQCGSCKECVNGQPQLCMTYMLNAFSDAHFAHGDGVPTFGMAGAGTFAEELILLEHGAVKISPDVPYDVASLLGCGVMTGVGAAINAARVEPGSSVVVFGCGGVGISVIQGARIAGAATIVAVDMVERKLDWAKQFGATHAVKPEELALVQLDLTGGAGFDYAFEVVGRGQTIKAAYDATRRGGTTVVVGVGRAEDMVEFSAFDLFYNEKNLRGTYYGSANIRRDFPRLLALWRSGQLDLEGMITRRLGLEDVNDAFAAMSSGEVIRQVITFD